MRTIAWGLADEPANTVAQRATPHERASQAMVRYAAGDAQAFAELYKLLAPRLHRFCILLAGRSDADDLLQEVFLKMHRARSSFAPTGSVLAWGFAITRTTWLDRQRARRARREDPAEHADLEHRSDTTLACPESSCSGQGLERALERELMRLSEALRAAYILVKLEELSCAEAAAVLGTSVSAVKQRVHRACCELQKAFDDADW